MSVVLISGTIAGLLLFVLQHFVVFPLIEKAEVFESAAKHGSSDSSAHDEGWRPAEGLQRAAFTALTTIVTAIGFSALLFGIASLASLSLDWGRGALLGLGAYFCIDLAPAWGLPPQPPGVAVADLYSRQLWWVATVILTAVSLWLLFDRRKSWLTRLIGFLGFLLPHAIGAPVATGESFVPTALIHQFALASILTTGVFWVVLGSIGGLLYRRSGFAEAQ
jgi:cobalt transporter subunit CbtA